MYNTLKKIMVALLLLATTTLNAQQQEKKQYAFSLQQAIEFAWQNQVDIKNATLDYEIAQKRAKELFGIGMPQISGSADINNFIDIPTTFVPAEFFNGEPGEFAPVKFGQKYSSSVGVSGSQLLFDGSYLVGVKAAKMYAEFIHKQANQTKIETAVTISKAYYNVLIANERMDLLTANVTRLKKLTDDTKAMYENGFVEKIDYDRTTLAYNNIVTEKEKTERLLILGVALLKFQMGMGVQDDLSLTDKLSDINMSTEITNADNIDVNGRIEMDILKMRKVLLEKDMKLKQSAYLPSLAAFGSYTLNASRNDFDIFEDHPWYRTTIVGVKLSVPIFDGFQKANRVKQARREVQKAENSIQSLTQGLQLEVLQSRTALINSLASLETQKQNRALATDIARITKLKYEQGVGSSLEVMDAETSLKEAETNYYAALFDTYIAKVDYAKATGTITKN